MKKYRILTFDVEPAFNTERDAEIHAQKLADENHCSVWYETDAGEAECVPTECREENH
jgi:hypothetical protein